MTKTMKIEGMMCGHCEASVKKVLEALPEVESAEVLAAASDPTFDLTNYAQELKDKGEDTTFAYIRAQVLPRHARR